MKIGVDARPLQQQRDGIGRYTATLLEQMTRSGEHHWFLYSSTPIESNFLEEQRASGLVTVRHAGTTPGFMSEIKAQFWFNRWSKKDALNVFWSPRHHLPLLGTGCPAIVTIHDLAWHVIPESMPSRRVWQERLLMPRAISAAKIKIAVSQATRRQLCKLVPRVSPESIRVIYEASCFRDHPNQSTQMLASDPYILIVGTLEPRKNLERSLTAYAKALEHSNTPRLLCVVGATGWKLKSLETLVLDLGLRDHVRLVGSCSDEQLRSWYAHCRFLLNASLYEGFSLPILEAQAFGKPVITSDLASMPEIAGAGAIIVDPTCIDAISKAICNLSADTKLYSTLATRARENSASYSWDAAAKETLSAIVEAGSSASPKQD